MRTQKADASFLPAALLTALGCLLGIFLCELALRFIPAYRFEAMAFVNTTLTGTHWTRRYRPSPVFGYELIPRAHPDINSFGMRDREYPLLKDRGTYRILLLGDSLAEYGNWSDHLESMLARVGRIEVLNAGVMGWGIFQYLSYLRTKGMRFEPDLVLVGLCLNDVIERDMIQTMVSERRGNRTLLYGVQVGGGDRFRQTLAINPWLFRNSSLYRFLMASFVLRRTGGVERFYGKELQEMKREAGGRILAVVFPYLKPLAQYDRQEAEEYRKTLEALDVSGIEYLDLTPHFNTYGEHIADFRLNAPDKIHYDERANRIKAGLIYRWLTPRIPPQEGNPGHPS